jgi:hypothetical protein
MGGEQIVHLDSIPSFVLRVRQNRQKQLAIQAALNYSKLFLHLLTT